jgi:hypothetical protein
LEDFVQLHCVFGNFYTRWVLNVFVVPAILAVAIALNFCWDRRDPQRDAGKRCRTLVFIVGFLIYPRVSKRIFEMFVCRHLSETQAWLEADYSIACTTSTHAGFVGLAGMLVILVPLGIPAFMIAKMIRATRGKFDEATNERLQHQFGFLMRPYRVEYLFYEGVDWIRKMCLGGLLMLLHRGSVEQVFVHFVRVLRHPPRPAPYRKGATNWLKACVVQIFLTIQVSILMWFSDQ